MRPGEGEWFKQVLQLGLDNYQDAWDVHAYPQRPPRFGGPIGNGELEDERGVLAAYARLGKTNKLPFWLGETGAKAMHGFSGRRWQAEQVAKIVAWANSRNDYLAWPSASPTNTIWHTAAYGIIRSATNPAKRRFTPPVH